MTLVIPRTRTPGHGERFRAPLGLVLRLSRISLTVTTPAEDAGTGRRWDRTCSGRARRRSSTSETPRPPRPTGPGDPGADLRRKRVASSGQRGVDLHVTPVFLGGGGGWTPTSTRAPSPAGTAPRGLDPGAMSEGTIGSPGDADSVVTVGAHATKACWPGGRCGPALLVPDSHPGSDRSLHEPGAAPRRRVQTGPHSTRARRHLVAFGGLRGGGAARDRDRRRAREFLGHQHVVPHVAGAQRFSWRGANGPPPDPRRYAPACRPPPARIASPARCRTGLGFGKAGLGRRDPTARDRGASHEGIPVCGGAVRFDPSVRFRIPADTITFFFSKDGGNTYPTLLGTVTNIPTEAPPRSSSSPILP